MEAVIEKISYRIGYGIVQLIKIVLLIFGHLIIGIKDGIKNSSPTPTIRSKIGKERPFLERERITETAETASIAHRGEASYHAVLYPDVQSGVYHDPTTPPEYRNNTSQKGADTLANNVLTCAYTNCKQGLHGVKKVFVQHKDNQIYCCSKCRTAQWKLKNY